MKLSINGSYLVLRTTINVVAFFISSSTDCVWMKKTRHERSTRLSPSLKKCLFYYGEQFTLSQNRKINEHACQNQIIETKWNTMYSCQFTVVTRRFVALTVFVSNISPMFNEKLFPSQNRMSSKFEDDQSSGLSLRANKPKRRLLQFCVISGKSKNL